MPFKFQMSSLDGRDINHAIEGLYQCARIEGQRDNIGLQYLLGLMCEEGERRNAGNIGGEIQVVIPFGEMTPAHVWLLTRFVCALVQAAAKGKPSAMAQFFARVIDEIELFAMRVQSSVAN